MTPRVVGKKVKETLDKAREHLALYGSFKSVFDNPDGDRVLRYLLKLTGLTSPKLTTDTSILLVREGQKQIVLTILKILGKNPQYLIDQVKKGMEE